MKTFQIALGAIIFQLYKDICLLIEIIESDSFSGINTHIDHIELKIILIKDLADKLKIIADDMRKHQTKTELTLEDLKKEV